MMACTVITPVYTHIEITGEGRVLVLGRPRRDMPVTGPGALASAVMYTHIEITGEGRVLILGRPRRDVPVVHSTLAIDPLPSFGQT